MNKQTLTVSSQSNRWRAASTVNGLPVDSDKWTIKIEPYKKDRSLAQNRLSFLWYELISKETGNTKQEVRRLCKWGFGLPILAESHESFNATWTRISENLTYEQQLEAMDFIEVTRLFKTGEFTAYLNDIELYYAGKHIILPHPDDLYYEALGYSKRSVA